MQKIYKIHEGTREGTLTTLDVGSKAFHLMKLVDLGYGDHILPGFAVQVSDPQSAHHGVVLEDSLVALFEELLRHSGQVIVRSNHAQEGVGKYSFSGVFDSVEHVTTIEQLEKAFEQVFASACQGKVEDYCAMNELSDFNPAMMRYLVQPQITPEVFAMFHNAGNVNNPEKYFRISFRAEGKESLLAFIHAQDSLFRYQKIYSPSHLLYFEHLRKEAEKIFGDTFSAVERKVEEIGCLAKKIEQEYLHETMEFEFGALNDKVYLFQRTPVHINMPSNAHPEISINPKYVTLVEARYTYIYLNNLIEEETVPLVVIDIPDGINPDDHVDSEVLRRYIEGLQEKINTAHHCAVVMTPASEYILQDYASSVQQYVPYVFNKLVCNAKYILSWYGLFGLRHEQMHLLERGQRFLEVDSSCQLGIFSKDPDFFEYARGQPFTKDRGYHWLGDYQIERFLMDKPFDPYPEYVKITTIGENAFIIPIFKTIKT